MDPIGTAAAGLAILQGIWKLVKKVASTPHKYFQSKKAQGLIRNIYTELVKLDTDPHALDHLAEELEKTDVRSPQIRRAKVQAREYGISHRRSRDTKRKATRKKAVRKKAKRKMSKRKMSRRKK
jgi:hypothetical protein